MIRILIADDHAIVRAGLRQFIADQSDMQVSGEAATGNETISLVRESEFDVVLLDISMPDKNGIDTLKTLKHVRPELPVLMLSGYSEDQYAVRVLRAGGTFVASVPNAYRLKNRLRFVLGRKPEEDPTHLQMFSPNDIRALLDGFEDVQLHLIAGRLVPLHARLGVPSREDDEGRQVAVLGAEAIADP